MTNRPAERAPLVRAFAAGILYLIVIVCGIFSEGFVRSSLIVPGDAAATASNILASEWLFRMGFAGDSIVFLSDAALAVLFYILLEPVSKTLALVAAAFRLAQTAILGMNLLNHYAALLILSGAEYLKSFEPDQLHALAMLVLVWHKHGYDLGLLFFGCHCFVLGYLLIKSDFFPAFLGMLLIAASGVYLTGSFTLFLYPRYADLISPMYAVALVAEVSLCFWLLARGLKLQKYIHE